jgi:glycosyltransferase involved in cell wall biosynthesis
LKPLPNKKIVIFTTGQPSINPRLVKEADTLIEAGYTVIVIYQYWNDWATNFDAELLKSKKWRYIRAGGSPREDKAVYWATRVRQKFYTFLAKAIGFKFGIAENAIGRCTALLAREGRKHPTDLYIAHNLAALPAAVKSAKFHQVKCGFDAEDYHRNEVSDNPADFDVRIKTYIEQKYFPQTDYLTASSTQIANLYQQNFPSKKITTLLNVFPKYTRAPGPTSLKGALKLFWFSQSVGLNRGITDVIGALKILENEAVEFHILGQLTAPVKNGLEVLIKGLAFKKSPHIIYHETIAPAQISFFATGFDIGLALEPGFSINNNNALSNKIFTYISVGLALIATSTAAQADFLNDYPALGKIYKTGDIDSLAAIIKQYIDDPLLLKQTKQASYNAGQTTLNWENESHKFLSVIQDTLAN